MMIIEAGAIEQALGRGGRKQSGCQLGRIEAYLGVWRSEYLDDIMARVGLGASLI